MTDTSKLDSRVTSHDARIDIEAAESLVSLHLQAATSVDDTEEELGDPHAPKTGKGKHKGPARCQVDLLMVRDKEKTR